MASFRKHAAKKKEPETDDAKAEPVDGAKVEAKDEDSGDESIDDSKCKNVPPGGGRRARRDLQLGDTWRDFILQPNQII